MNHLSYPFCQFLAMGKGQKLEVGLNPRELVEAGPRSHRQMKAREEECYQF